MAKLHFIHSTMNAGKSAQLLQVNFNYQERGMKCLLLTAAVDGRFGHGKITSRIGISADAMTFATNDDILEKFMKPAAREGVACVLIDEAQFLSGKQVRQIARGVDTLGLPVMAYGLRSNFRGELFEGSAALLALADEIRETRTVCDCGSKATMVLRKDSNGNPTLGGEEVQIGGEDSYVSLCRKHWFEAHDKVKENQPE